MTILAKRKFLLSVGELKRELAAHAAANETAETILAAVEQPLQLGVDHELRHLSGQVRRQFDLPRDAGRDGRFLSSLEHALRDLAVRAAGVK